MEGINYFGIFFITAITLVTLTSTTMVAYLEEKGSK